MSTDLSTATEDEILTEVRGRILVITLNRPAAFNAINTALVQRLQAAVDLLDASDSLAVGIITGGPTAFCSGIDLKAFAKEGLPKGLFEFYSGGSTKPLIAALEGPVLAGGLELALTCDILVGSSTTTYAIPEARVGLIAAGGGLIRLPRRIGYGMAMELALTGRPLDSTDAFRLGLINHLTEPGETLDVALGIADQIAQNAPLSVAASKQLLSQAHSHTDESFWQLQRPHLRSVVRSDDAKEGARAFAQKRPPQWKGA